ncbi:MAG: sulfatase [Planctomycetia bacterium]|nr:sulfatase [Planctomycetia bacterium]
MLASKPWPTAYSLRPLFRLAIAGWLVLLACWGLGPRALGAGRRPPNVLVICADDHAAYVTGAYGNKTVRTPNIDRLAAGGIRFLRAYCNSPVCTASRQSFLTGRYPRSIGVTRLETPLPESEVTMAETLRLAGFDTAAIGKMHFNSDSKHGFDVRIDLAEHRAWLAGQSRDALPTDLEVQPPWRPFKDPARVWLNSFCRPVGATDREMDGTYFAEQAAAYLQSPRAKPFFLMVSFYEPHSPFRFPLEYRGRHDPAKFIVPKLGPEDDEQIPAVFRGLTDAEKQGIAAAYYTSVEFMDKNVGLVLEALDRSGQARDTIVIYLGDHGYLLGQHGRFEKHTSYEEAIRVPLVMRFPNRIAAGRGTQAFVELVDLVPTIYELCDYQVTAGLQGRSLLPLLRGTTTRHREHVIVEYAPNEEVMIRDQYWKLIYARGAERRTDGYDTPGPLVRNKFRLYDLVEDPGEMNNVAQDPAHAEVVKRMRDLLVEHLAKTARQPELLPASVNPLTVLDFCVQSRDVPRPSKGN